MLRVAPFGEIQLRDPIHLIVGVRRRVVVEDESTHAGRDADLDRLVGRGVAVVREPRVFLGQEVRVVDHGVDALQALDERTDRIASSAALSASDSGSGPDRKCCLCST